MNATNISNHSYDTTTTVITAMYDGFLKFENFKSISLRSIELMKEHKSGKLLVDTSQLKVMPKENQEWIKAVWFPRAMSAGLSRMAFLVPDNPFGRASMEAANREAKDGGAVPIKYFFNRTEAENWLNE